MLLEGKEAVVWGAGGGMGGEMSRAFARHGATVHLTGRTRQSLDKVAHDILTAGGAATTAVVDAYDEDAITAYLATLDRIDISFNAVGLSVVQNQPMIDIPLEDLVRPVEQAARTQFATGRAVARRMIAQGSGVILALSSSAAHESGYEMGGFSTAVSAVEGFVRALGGEVGKYGVRVVALRPNFTPETVGEPVDLTHPALVALVTGTSLKRLPLLAEVGETAAFLASEHAGAITSNVVDLSCGAIVD